VFRADDAPRYIRAFIAHMAVYGVQLVTIVLLRIRLMHQNVLKRRAQGMLLSQTSGEASVSFIYYYIGFNFFLVTCLRYRRMKILPINMLLMI
jgi:hypothetical protein